MLQNKSWVKIGFLFLILLIGIAFCALLISRFQQNNRSTPANHTQHSAEKVEAAALSETDKTELPQTEMISVEPSADVMNAEKSLPVNNGAAYASACQRLKEMYLRENSSKLAEENKRYSEAQQSIINKYSSAGLSFSSRQKNAQSSEAKRHDYLVRQLASQLQKQLAGINC